MCIHLKVNTHTMCINLKANTHTHDVHNSKSEPIHDVHQLKASEHMIFIKLIANTQTHVYKSKSEHPHARLPTLLLQASHQNRTDFGKKIVSIQIAAFPLVDFTKLDFTYQTSGLVVVRVVDIPNQQLKEQPTVQGLSNQTVNLLNILRRPRPR